MSNWFSGVYLASSGVNAAQYGLSVVGQNMTNAATAGYVRQTVQQSAVDQTSTKGIYTGAGTVGGTTVTATTRSTDASLDARVRVEHARASLASTTASTLSDVESMLGEPSTTGLSSQLSTFWNAWGDVANNSSSTSAARTALLTDANTIASTLNAMSTSLSSVTTGVAQSLSSDASSLNTAASQLATLNGSITVGTATGANVNSLLDQRDQLLDTISKLSGGTITLDTSGAATVTVGGQTLVSGNTAATVGVDGSNNLTIDGQTVTADGGTIAARVTALNTTLPSYSAALDSVADALSSTVNTAQAGAYDASGNSGSAIFGGSGAAGITVVMTDPLGVAASSQSGTLDGTAAQAVSQSGTAVGSADSLWASLVSTVATASAAATQSSTTQSSVASTVDGLKSSMSGVSIDEEAANMLVYQQAFSASARVLTAMDQMLDTLINHTGTVGLA